MLDAALPDTGVRTESFDNAAKRELTGLAATALPAVPVFGPALLSADGLETTLRVAFPPIRSSVALIRLLKSVTILAALERGYFCSDGARIGDG
jgi:hypothetical protein